MFQHILVPLDGSTRAEQALPVATRIARATGGSLLLVQVVPQPIDYSGGWAPIVAGEMIEVEMDGATDYLKAMAASQLLAGIETRTEVSLGMAAQYLIAVTEEHEVDLVVLCSHGRTGFTRWALGSVAHSLVHQSAVPVLVLRQEEALSLSSNGDRKRPLRTLVPLDGSPLAEAALSPATHLTAALAAPGRGALHLVQVVKPFPSTTEEGVVSELNAEAIQRAKAYLAHVVERLQGMVKDLRLAVTYSVELGTDVASTLVNLAEHRSEGKDAEGVGACDLIAISTHGRGGLERWVMGSVTDRVLNTTRLPMLTVRPPKKG
jgi:nucleotide-binding universal stress UspA family protein